MSYDDISDNEIDRTSPDRPSRRKQRLPDPPPRTAVVELIVDTYVEIIHYRDDGVHRRGRFFIEKAFKLACRRLKPLPIRVLDASPVDDDALIGFDQTLITSAE